MPYVGREVEFSNAFAFHDFGPQKSPNMFWRNWDNCRKKYITRHRWFNYFLRNYNTENMMQVTLIFILICKAFYASPCLSSWHNKFGLNFLNVKRYRLKCSLSFLYPACYNWLWILLQKFTQVLKTTHKMTRPMGNFAYLMV